ncbi:hypothetical protein [Paraburkholderia sp. J12]|uniref:hypothetical protein n=1 Tax=Paraburkholderia sp. J12 TaxID=2805432 RepID=UPI002ABD40BB|nr:hypothetical protein [Paraburkholderia sp. J12]
MLYLKNALGGLGRSVTDTARLAFAQAGAAGRAAGWRKLAVYAAMFVLPGGSLAVLLFMGVQRLRAKHAHASSATSTAVVCAGRQAACRAACAGYTPHTRAGAYALKALRRWRRNDA